MLTGPVLAAGLHTRGSMAQRGLRLRSTRKKLVPRKAGPLDSSTQTQQQVERRSAEPVVPAEPETRVPNLASASLLSGLSRLNKTLPPGVASARAACCDGTRPEPPVWFTLVPSKRALLMLHKKCNNTRFFVAGGRGLVPHRYPYR